MRIHRKKNPIIHSYNMKGDRLSAVSSQAYLGVEIHEKLSWKPHIAKYVTSKASQSLGFIRRNLAQCSTATKQLAYTTLVRSQLEYAGAIWDPYRQNQVDQLERVQRRAVRFISGNYNREDSVTAMREELGLPSLQKRRRHSRWVMVHKIIHGHVAIPLPDYTFNPGLALPEANNSTVSPD
ncbi:uncharacterized protein [Amphiura filiformis]|uniref:uncharacterized protein n=1 Tax=Amphiura filiformis TaxID=82378 RepID=UPI003B21AB25